MLVDKVYRYSFFIFYLLSLVFSLFLLTGCAEMVSGAKPDAGSELSVQVKFGSNPQPENYKYVFIYSQKQIALPNKTNYMFLPGQDVPFPVPDGITSPSSNGTINTSKDVFINYYYENYFSSWSDYIYLSNISGIKKIELYDARSAYFPITGNQVVNYDSSIYIPVNLESIGYGSLIYVTGDYHLDLRFQIQALGTDSMPVADQKIYFNFFTISSNGTIVDYYDNSIINRKSQSIERIIGSSGTFNDLYSIKVTVI